MKDVVLKIRTSDTTTQFFVFSTNDKGEHFTHAYTRFSNGKIRQDEKRHKTSKDMGNALYRRLRNAGAVRV